MRRRSLAIRRIRDGEWCREGLFPTSARPICWPVIAPGLCSRGVSGAKEQQRETGSRRGWWLVGLLAVSGAAVGAFAGHRLDPDVSELAPSLAVAGLGLGGLVGLFLLAPVGLWRAWRRRRARRRAGTLEPGHARRPRAVAYGRPGARLCAGRCGRGAGAGCRRSARGGDRAGPARG